MVYILLPVLMVGGLTTLIVTSFVKNKEQINTIGVLSFVFGGGILAPLLYFGVPMLYIGDVTFLMDSIPLYFSTSVGVVVVFVFYKVISSVIKKLDQNPKTHKFFKFFLFVGVIGATVWLVYAVSQIAAIFDQYTN